MNRQEFLDALRAGRAAWDALLAQIDEARMTEPGVEGDLSLKDIIAHVAWYEREMIGVIRTRALAGSEWWDRPLDERNRLIYEANRDRALAEVLAEARQVSRELLEAAETLSDEDLLDARRFREMPEDWKPWEVIASNAFQHYPEHMPDIRAWLEK